MATIPTKMAVPPLPKMGERPDDTPPAVEVIEEHRGPREGWVITIVTRNTH